MTESYRVRITKDHLVFSAGHFITFNGNICERLHGHNYRVAAEVCGPLDENHYVVDFVALRQHLQRVVDELDHHMLLPTLHPMIHVVADEREVEARFADRRWVFPRGDCVLLPVPNTTSELLARHIAGRVAEALPSLGGDQVTAVHVEVDECFGQLAICTLQLPLR